MSSASQECKCTASSDILPINERDAEPASRAIVRVCMTIGCRDCSNIIFHAL